MARRGGRRSKLAVRSAPLEDNQKPIQAGEMGGQFKPFTENDVTDVIKNIYRILEEIGFSQATPHCIETCLAYGAKLGDDGRLRMPKEIVDRAINE